MSRELDLKVMIYDQGGKRRGWRGRRNLDVHTPEEMAVDERRTCTATENGNPAADSAVLTVMNPYRISYLHSHPANWTFFHNYQWRILVRL